MRSRTCWPTVSGWPRGSATRLPREPSPAGRGFADGSRDTAPAGHALYCRGLLDHEASLLLRAVDRYHDACRPLLGAQALEAAAVVFLDGGDRAAARAAFTRALSTGIRRSVPPGMSAGCRPLPGRRVSAVVPRVKHRKAQRGWESLTPTEIKVVGLVAEGLSNPQIAARLFLSHRTVATHVSHVLSKLGVRSRIDIAREAASQRAVASAVPR